MRCPACPTTQAVDLWTLDRHPWSAISSLIPLTDKSIADELHDEHRCRVALVGHTLHSPSLFALVHPMVRTEGSGGAAWCGITVYLTLSDEDLFFLGQGHDFIMATRTGTTKSSCIRSGCFSISLRTVWTICGFIMPFGGQESLIARNVSKTPTVFRCSSSARLNMASA